MSKRRVDVKLLGPNFTFLLNSALKCAPRTMANRGKNAAEHIKPRCVYRGLPPRKLTYRYRGLLIPVS
jgi:hypothetical protein